MAKKHKYHESTSSSSETESPDEYDDDATDFIPAKKRKNTAKNKAEKEQTEKEKEDLEERRKINISKLHGFLITEEHLTQDTVENTRYFILIILN